MFPEYRDLITQLKATDRRFIQLFDKHNDLDQKIKNFEAHIQNSSEAEIEALKKEKLALKDQIFEVLQSHSQK